MGQRAGLAGAGTGDDQQRTVDRLGRAALIVVELGEDAGRHGFRLAVQGGGRPQARRPSSGVAGPAPSRTSPVRRGDRQRASDMRLRLGRFAHRRLEQQAAGREPLQLALLEQADHAVFAVVAGLADHLAGAQPRDRLGEQRGAGARDVLDRHRLQDRRAPGRARRCAGRSCARPSSTPMPLAAISERISGSGTRFDTAPAVGGGATSASLAVGEHLDAVLDADRHAARRTPGSGRRAPASPRA